MKFLAFVDLHDSKKAYGKLKKLANKKDISFVVCAGDFTIFEQHVKSWVGRIAKLHKKVFLVHGNHENASVVRTLCSKHKSVEFIHQRMVEFKDIILIGWGGGGFAQTDPEFEAWVRAHKKKIKKSVRAGKKVLFVVHAPIYKTKLDMIIDSHLGCRSFRWFIKQFKPSIGICGHFHENAGKQDKIKKCRVYNPGPLGRIIDI